MQNVITIEDGQRPARTTPLHLLCSMEVPDPGGARHGPADARGLGVPAFLDGRGARVPAAGIAGADAKRFGGPRGESGDGEPLGDQFLAAREGLPVPARDGAHAGSGGVAAALSPVTQSRDVMPKVRVFRFQYVDRNTGGIEESPDYATE